MRTLTMKPRIATLVPVLAAGIAVAGCSSGDPSAAGPVPSGSQSSSPRLGVSVAPSNAPTAAGSAGPAGPAGSPGTPGAPGASGGTRGGANGGGGSSAAALPAPNGNSGLGSLPVGFPLPDGTMLGRIAVSATDITAPMQVPNGAKAAVFWTKQLPAAGYKISSAKVEKEIGDIKFTGNGCKRGSDIAISGEQVAFFCRR
jgi:hypothetical protein